MSRRRGELRATPQVLLDKARPPIGVVLGSPQEVQHLIVSLVSPTPHPTPPAPGGRGQEGFAVTCYQMDLFPAKRIEEELGTTAPVKASADLWDLGPEFQTLIYLPAKGGERELKLDMIEQAYHTLKPHGTFIVWSPYEEETFFPPQLKKVFGKVHEHATEGGKVLICHRDGDRARRRHEITFQARIGNGSSCRFVSRPGTFSYGRFDAGARALLETAEIKAGDRVLDLGCGCGTNGILAWQRAAPGGHVTFVDSNLRALALAELNARENGVASFDLVATPRVEGLKEKSYDVLLVNPPYFAQSSIAKLFVERGQELLKPDGRFYLVAKQPNELAEMMVETFGSVEAEERRGYVVLIA